MEQGTPPKPPPIDRLRGMMFSRQPEAVNRALSGKTVGIIGLGGLGSHVAYMMAKSGVTRIIAADFDEVSATNLARQYYMIDQVGLPKTMALEYMLRFLMPDLRFTAHQERVTAENIGDIFGESDLMFECVDDADTKAMLFGLARTTMSDVPWVFVSGIGGAHSASEMKVRRVAPNIAVVGDEAHPDTEGVTISRVMQAASMQVLTGIRMLMGEEP